jgi:hypothetical protein
MLKSRVYLFTNTPSVSLCLLRQGSTTTPTGGAPNQARRVARRPQAITTIPISSVLHG